MLRNNADARRYSYFLGLPAWCKCYSLRAQSIKAKREYLILSCQSLLLIRLKNITKYLKNKRTINSFIIFSVFSGMRPCSLGTRERSIFGTHTLAPTRWRSKWCNVVLHVGSWKLYERSCFDTNSSENVNSQLFFRLFEILWEFY